MQNRRRGLWQNIMGALGRMLNAGGAAEQAAPSVRPEEAPRQEEHFEPLPESRRPEVEERVEDFNEPGPGTTIIDEVFTADITPTGGNITYISSHYTESSNGRQVPVLGRWEVSRPALGDVQDILDETWTTFGRVIVGGMMTKYAGIEMSGWGWKSYVFDRAEVQYVIDHRDERPVVRTAEDLLNALLRQAGDEWSQIDYFQVVNEEDEPS